MLDPFSRGTMLALSTLCVAGAVGLATQSARSSSEPRLPQLSPAAITAAPQPAGEAVIRDPFAEPPRSVAAGVPAVSATASGSSSGDALSSGSNPGRLEDGITALPSNLPHDTIPAVPGSPPEAARSARVTAVVTGAHPYAMLESAGVHVIKGLGDRLDGVAITGIDISGVALADGRRLRVDAAGRP